MGAVWLRARAQLRGRLRASLLLALLVGLSGGVVLAAVAGARRSDAALPRFLAASRTTDTVVYVSGPSHQPGQPAGSDLAAELRAIAGLPQVLDAQRFSPLILSAADPAGRSGPSRQLGWVGLDRAGYELFGRPRFVEGSPPDLGRADEAAVDEEFAWRHGLRVGAVLRIGIYTRAQFGPAGEGLPIPPEGPAVGLRVTGIVRFPDDLLPVAERRDEMDADESSQPVPHPRLLAPICARPRQLRHPHRGRPPPRPRRPGGVHRGGGTEHARPGARQPGRVRRRRDRHRRGAASHRAGDGRPSGLCRAGGPGRVAAGGSDTWSPGDPRVRRVPHPARARDDPEPARRRGPDQGGGRRWGRGRPRRGRRAGAVAPHPDRVGPPGRARPRGRGRLAGAGLRWLRHPRVRPGGSRTARVARGPRSGRCPRAARSVRSRAAVEDGGSAGNGRCRTDRGHRRAPGPRARPRKDRRAHPDRHGRGDGGRVRGDRRRRLRRQSLAACRQPSRLRRHLGRRGGRLRLRRRRRADRPSPPGHPGGCRGGRADGPTGRVRRRAVGPGARHGGAQGLLASGGDRGPRAPAVGRGRPRVDHAEAARPAPR